MRRSIFGREGRNADVAGGYLSGRPAVQDVVRVRKRDGSYAWFETHFRPIWIANGQVSEIEGTMTDITRRKEAELKIAALAKTDPLTGIANRATFIERLEQAFAHCKDGAKPFAVLYIDLDRFKDVNDTLGHSAGDILLKAAVDRLAKISKPATSLRALAATNSPSCKPDCPALRTLRPSSRKSMRGLQSPSSSARARCI